MCSFKSFKRCAQCAASRPANHYNSKRKKKYNDDKHQSLFAYSYRGNHLNAPIPCFCQSKVDITFFRKEATGEQGGETTCTIGML